MAKSERIAPRLREREEATTQISELEEGLRINKNGLDDALLQQPDFFYRVSKALTLATSRRDAIKQEVQELEAEMDERVRARAEADRVKLTETEAKMQIRLEPKMKQANLELLRANREVGQLAALKESFSQRSYALKELVSLYVAEYFGDNTGSAVGSVRDAQAGKARRAMAEKRRERGDSY